MSSSQKKINGDYRKFLRELLAGGLVLAVQSPSDEVMQYSPGQLGSARKTGDKDHHWDKHDVSSYSHCFLP